MFEIDTIHQSKVTLKLIYKTRNDFVRKKAVYREFPKKWVAITAGTVLFCIVFRIESVKKNVRHGSKMIQRIFFLKGFA